MPIESIRRVATEISRRWTQEERLRRTRLAGAMQAQLLSLAGAKLVPAYAQEKSR